MGRKATHEVACAVCGRTGKVAVDDNGKISDRGWNFFGKFNVNYEAAAAILKLEVPDYTKSEAVPVEYWECKDCYRDMEQVVKNAR